MLKKIILGFVALLLVAVIGVGVYAFAFDKTIPTNWVSGQIEDVKESKLSEDDKMPSMKVNYEMVVYTKDGETTTQYYSTKYYRELKNKSTKEAEGYEIVVKDYNEQGNVTEDYVVKYYIEGGKYYRARGEVKEEIENFDEVAMFYILVAGYYGDDLKFNDDVRGMINNNLDHVSHRGLLITLHLVKDNYELNITYNLVSKKIEKIESITKTYENNVLASQTRECVEFC